MPSVFETIMNVCSKITQAGKGRKGSSSGLFKDSNKETSKDQDRKLRYLGLCVIEAIISSLVCWSSVDEPANIVAEALENGIDEVFEDSKDSIMNPVVYATRNPLENISMTQVNFS